MTIIVWLVGGGMGRKKISTTVYITEEQNERLKILHQRTKVPVAEFIREGIDMVLEQHRHLLPGQMSLREAGFDEKAEV